MYIVYKTILSLSCLSMLGLTAMDQPPAQALPVLPHDIWRLLLEDSLPGQNKLLNILVRQFGLNPATADKIIIPYMEQTKLYPYSQEAIQIMLTSFKTAVKGVNLQSEIKRALERYKNKYPLLMALHARDLVQFQTLAQTTLPSFNPGVYFNQYLPEPLPGGHMTPQSLNYICRNLQFSSADQAQELRTRLIDLNNQIDTCIELIKSHIRGLKQSKATRDNIFVTFRPVVILAPGLAGAGFMVLPDNRPPLLTQNLFIPAIMGAVTSTLNTSAHFFYPNQTAQPTLQQGTNPYTVAAVTAILIGASAYSPPMARLILAWAGAGLCTVVSQNYFHKRRTNSYFATALNENNPIGYPALMHSMQKARRACTSILEEINRFIRDHQN